MNIDEITTYFTEIASNFEKIMAEISKILKDTPKKNIQYDGKTYSKNPWPTQKIIKSYISCPRAFIPRVSKLRETKRIRHRKQS